MAGRYEFYVRVAETVLPRGHKIHIFEPKCNVLFIVWRPNVVDIADFYVIVFENSSQFYKLPHCSSS